MLADTLISQLISLQLIKPKPPETEGYKSGYAMFEPLQDIHVDSSKHTPMPPMGISSNNATINNNV